MQIINNYVLCEKMEKVEKKSASGLYLANETDKSCNFKVVAVPEQIFNHGSGTYRNNIHVEAGDEVFIQDGLNYKTVAMDIDGKGVAKDYYLFNFDQIVCVFGKEEK